MEKVKSYKLNKMPREGKGIFLDRQGRFKLLMQVLAVGPVNEAPASTKYKRECSTKPKVANCRICGKDTPVLLSPPAN